MDNLPSSFICKSPSFCPRKFNVRLPSSWYFKRKKITEDEGKDFLKVVFHELSHFHHLLGTTYGVYYYATRFTQLIFTFMSLRIELQENKTVKLPINNGFSWQAREMFEGFLDYLEGSYAQDLFKKINLDRAVNDKVIVSKKSEHCRRERVLLHQALFVVEEDNNKKLSVPIGAHAIMENYAKHLEYMNNLLNPKATSSAYEKYFYYYFLIFQVLRLKSIPEEAKNEVLSVIFYIALMGITPVITEPDKVYFGTCLRPDALKQLDTLKLLRYPGLVFYDALNATIEIAKDEPAILKSQDFIHRLCEKLSLPDIEKLNLQLKRFICFILEEYKKLSYLVLFPFVEYYFEMSLKFIDTIMADPLPFINGKITKETALLLFDPNAHKGINKGFIHKYPVPSILVEHTYDKLGRIAEHTGMGDSGKEQLFLELYWDIYEQLFINKNLYCYSVRHIPTEAEGCERLKLCEPGKSKLNYDNCSQFHRGILKTIFGNYTLLQ